MASELFEPPEWLPDGWIMEVRRGDDGTIYKYYTCPIHDYTFRTENEVMLYLKMMNADCDDEYEIMECVEHEYPLEVIEESVQILRRMRNLVEWMPRGWIMEVRKQEDNKDKRYKCYVNRSTGSTFYSKEEALQFLQSGNVGSHSAYLKSSRVSDSNVIAQIEYSPDGVPPGWIKENTVKGVKGSSTIRKDPYYLDPESGFAFRSKKEVAVFTDFGVVSKYGFRPKRNGIFDMRCVGSMEAPKAQEITTDGRHLGKQIPNSELTTKNDEQLEKTKIPCSSYDSPNRIMDGKDSGKRKIVQVTEQEDEKSLELLCCSKEKGNDMIKKLCKSSDSTSTPLKTFFRKNKRCTSKIGQSNVSNDKTSKQSYSALSSLSPEEKLQNESHKASSTSHDLHIAKAVMLTANPVENEQISPLRTG